MPARYSVCRRGRVENDAVNTPAADDPFYLSRKGEAMYVRHVSDLYGCNNILISSRDYRCCLSKYQRSN